MAYLPTKVRSEFVWPRKPFGDTACASSLRPNVASPASIRPPLRCERASTVGDVPPACVTVDGDGCDAGWLDPAQAAMPNDTATEPRRTARVILMNSSSGGWKESARDQGATS